MGDGQAVRLVPVHARDLDGHVAGAAHGHAVAARREQQELLLQLLAVRLQHLQVRSVGDFGVWSSKFDW